MATKSIPVTDVKEILLKKALTIKKQQKKLEEELEDLKYQLRPFLNVGEGVYCSDGCVVLKDGRTTFTWVLSEAEVRRIKDQYIKDGVAKELKGEPFLEFKLVKMT